MTVDLSMDSMYVIIVVFVSFLFDITFRDLDKWNNSRFHVSPVLMIIRPSITGECDNLI